MPDFIAAATPDVRREDASILCEIMQHISGEEPRMWGPSMVGFGVNHYKYESGREGEIFRIGFSPRKHAMVIYGLMRGGEDRILALGKVTTGKGCTYIKTLADVNIEALTTLLDDVWRAKEG